MIRHLHLYRFRNLSDFQLNFVPGFNLIYGQNGSGKTSILESIYFLTTLKSFRAATAQQLIQHGKEDLTVYVETDGLKAGIRRSVSGQTEIHLNGEPTNSVATITQALPVLLVHSGTFHLLDAGPEYRRELLDWGAFHVEHSYLNHWRAFRLTLKQRNTALKQGLSDAEVYAWNEMFEKQAQAMHEARLSFFQSWLPILEATLRQLLPEFSFQLKYRCGWSLERPLSELLQSSLAQDRRLQYSTIGPQRADIEIWLGDHLAKEVLSRGQQKLFIVAMKLAQGAWMQQACQKNSVYLLDDLPSELDDANRNKVFDMLRALKVQALLTSVDPQLSCLSGDANQIAMFHMEQ